MINCKMVEFKVTGLNCQCRVQSDSLTSGRKGSPKRWIAAGMKAFPVELLTAKRSVVELTPLFRQHSGERVGVIVKDSDSSV